MLNDEIKKKRGKKLPESIWVNLPYTQPESWDQDNFI